MQKRVDKLLIETGKLFEFFSYDLTLMIEKFLEILAKVVRYDSVCIIQLNSENSELEVLYERGTDLGGKELSGLVIEDFLIYDDGLNIPCNLVQQQTPQSANPVFRKGGATESFINLPLIVNSRVTGLLFVGRNRGKRSFDQSDLEIVYRFSSMIAVGIENIKLFYRSSDALDHLKRIQSIEREIAELLDSEELIRRAVVRIREICPYDAAAIFVPDESGKTFLVKAVQPARVEAKTITVAELEKTTKEILLDTKESVFTGNIEREPALSLFKLVVSARSVLVIPIHHKNRLSSLLVLNSRHLHFFTDEVRGQLGVLCHHLAISIQNAFYYEKIREKVEEVEKSNILIREYSEQLKRINVDLEKSVEQLTTLFEIGKTINSSPSLDETLKIILDRTISMVNADHGSIMLLDNESGKLELKVRNLPIPENKAVRKLRLGQGIAGWVARTGRAKYVENVKEEPLYFRHPGETVRDFSLIAVPLKIEERVIGVLNVEKSLGTGPFTMDDMSILGAIAENAAMALEKSRHIQDAVGLFEQTIGALAQAIEAKDSYTFGHTERVKILAEMIARKLNLSDEEVKVISRAALLHDIGKIGIPEKILLKPTRLTDEEREIIKEHSVMGANILQPIEQLREEALLILHHHEHWNGSGYPDGLKEEEIPVGSRINLVADTYDSITTDRPYHKAKQGNYAVEEIKRNSGIQFDPLVVGAFELVIEEYQETIMERGL